MVFQSGSGSPKQPAASRRVSGLTKRRPSAPKSLGPAPSRSRLLPPASRPQFPRPQNRSRHPVDSSPVFWITKPPSGVESGAGKPKPHSPSVESRIPDPRTGDPYPESSRTTPASRSGRTVPEKVEVLPKEKPVASKLAAKPLPFVRLLPPRRGGSDSGVAGDHPRKGGTHAARSTLVIQRTEHDIRGNQHSPTGVPSEPTASCQNERGPGQVQCPEERASRRFEPTSWVGKPNRECAL